MKHISFFEVIYVFTFLFVPIHPSKLKSLKTQLSQASYYIFLSWQLKQTWFTFLLISFFFFICPLFLLFIYLFSVFLFSFFPTPTPQRYRSRGENTNQSETYYYKSSGVIGKKGDCVLGYYMYQMCMWLCMVTYIYRRDLEKDINYNQF